MSAGDELRDQARDRIRVARQRHHGDYGLHALIIDLAPATVQGPAVRLGPCRGNGPSRVPFLPAILDVNLRLVAPVQGVGPVSAQESVPLLIRVRTPPVVHSSLAGD